MNERPQGLLTQGQAEMELMRLSGDLEETTYALAIQSEKAAEAEVAWKRTEAKLMLTSQCTSSEARKADALLKGGNAYRDHRINEALRDSLTEKCRTLRAQLGAIQTVSANLRGQT